MNWLPANIGAEPKKVALLSGLVLVLAVVFFLNRDSSNSTTGLAVESPGAALTKAAPSPLAALQPAAEAVTVPRVRPVVPAETLPMPGQRTAPTQAALSQPNPARRTGNSIQDFRPTLKLPEGTDVSRIDPELHLDAMALVRNLPMEGGRRSLFEFGTIPTAAPRLPKLEPVKPAPLPVPAVVEPPKPAEPPKPLPPPPIPLKFYGYITGRAPIPPPGSRRAFFLDGEDIVVAGENELIRNRYKVIRIDATAAVVEDISTKSQQTLRLVEEVPG
jgi:hypothetical protein